LNTTALIVSILLGYLLGSIPNALLIGKIFYRTDIRNFGSKNLGGTNAGRVLGKKAGLLVMSLDVAKTVVFFLINLLILQNVFNINDNNVYLVLGGLATVIGHCYPIFAQFKGGKAVSTAAGFIIASNYLLAIVGFVSFFIVLKITKMVSASSLLASISVVLFSFIGITGSAMLFGLSYNLLYNLVLVIIVGLIWYRHRENIKRLLTKSERKITWLK
jgi:acyl phosphate:glycerol-3-phosphate acyltransferase